MHKRRLHTHLIVSIETIIRKNSKVSTLQNRHLSDCEVRDKFILITPNMELLKDHQVYILYRYLAYSPKMNSHILNRFSEQGQ